MIRLRDFDEVWLPIVDVRGAEEGHTYTLFDRVTKREFEELRPLFLVGPTRAHALALRHRESDHLLVLGQDLEPFAKSEAELAAARVRAASEEASS